MLFRSPGNLGVVLRSCEAFGIDALILADTRVDFYNLNVIRSSVGCLFGMNIYQTSNEELHSFLLKHQYNIYTTFDFFLQAFFLGLQTSFVFFQLPLPVLGVLLHFLL